MVSFALPPLWVYGSHTAWFSNEGPSWGLTSLAFKEVSLLRDTPNPRVAQQGPIPRAHFQPLLPGVSSSVLKPQEEQNEDLLFCIPLQSCFPPA